MWPFKYPYTNFHELNLDWILAKVQECSDSVSQIPDIVEKTVREMVDINALYDDVLAALAERGIVVDPRTFGAVGDGVTDDYQAFQAAINAVPHHGLLYIPDGDFFIGYHGQTNGLLEIINKSISIIGTGYGSKICADRKTPSNINVIYWHPRAIQSNKNITLTNFRIFPSGNEGDAPSCAKHGIYIDEKDGETHVEQCDISYLDIGRVNGYGIYLDNPTGRDGFFCSTILHNAMGGMYLDGAGDSIRIRDNTLSNTKDTNNRGIYARFVTGAACSEIATNNITSRGVCMTVIQGENILISNNQIECLNYATTSAAINISKSNLARIVSNNINGHNKVAEAISMNDCENVTISGNMFSNCQFVLYEHGNLTPANLLKFSNDNLYKKDGVKKDYPFANCVSSVTNRLFMCNSVGATLVRAFLMGFDESGNFLINGACTLTAQTATVTAPIPNPENVSATGANWSINGNVLTLTGNVGDVISVCVTVPVQW